MLVQLLAMLLPWTIRRRLLARLYGFVIDPSAHVGLSILGARQVVLGPGSRIASFTLVRGLDRLVLGAHARLGSLNWVAAFPTSNRSSFGHVVDRDAALVIGDHASITRRHMIDCTGGLHIGAFSVVGGWNSQFVSHSIDPTQSRQDAEPIHIGRYCFIGTRVVLLKGSSLPDYSILAAGSVLSHAHDGSHGLFSGVPATRVRDLPQDMAFFHRPVGRIV